MFLKTLFALAFTALAATSALAQDPDYRLSVTAADMKVGLPGAIVVKLDVLGGYKWNTEYPAKINVSGMPDTLLVPKPSFAQLAGDFKLETPHNVVVNVPIIAKAALKAPVTLDLKFVVCDERVCIVKKTQAKVVVTARK